MVEIRTLPKIDAHIHISRFDERYINIAYDYNMRMITVNTDADVFASPKGQESVALEYLNNCGEMFAYIATFSADSYLNGGVDCEIDNVNLSLKNGAVGVKIWKNIGMELQNSSGEFIMASDQAFDALYNHLSNNKIPLLAHLGEPKNCWLPLNEMTSDRNRSYFTRFPEYHMFSHPNYPSYNEHIDARDEVLRRFPSLCFIGAHLGSMEWSIEQIAERFEQYPNFSVDLASRINHLQFQSQKDYSDVREFMIKYADRIIYGSDVIDDIEKMELTYNNDWQYLATDSCECVVESSGRCRGLNLPYEVLQKIYFINAINRYSSLKKQFKI